MEARAGAPCVYVGCDLNDLRASEAKAREIAESAGRNRHPDQRRRSHNQQAVRGLLARGLRGPDSRQFLRRLRADARRRAWHEAQGLRQDRQLLLADPERPLGRICPLCRVERRDARPDQVAGARARSRTACASTPFRPAPSCPRPRRAYSATVSSNTTTGSSTTSASRSAFNRRRSPTSSFSLLRQLSDMITGQNIAIDGGW